MYNVLKMILKLLLKLYIGLNQHLIYMLNQTLDTLNDIQNV